MSRITCLLMVLFFSLLGPLHAASKEEKDNFEMRGSQIDLDRLLSDPLERTAYFQDQNIKALGYSLENLDSAHPALLRDLRILLLDFRDIVALTKDKDSSYKEIRNRYVPKTRQIHQTKSRPRFVVGVNYSEQEFERKFWHWWNHLAEYLPSGDKQQVSILISSLKNKFLDNFYYRQYTDVIDFNSSISDRDQLEFFKIATGQDLYSLNANQILRECFGSVELEGLEDMTPTIRWLLKFQDLMQRGVLRKSFLEKYKESLQNHVLRTAPNARKKSKDAKTYLLVESYVAEVVSYTISDIYAQVAKEFFSKKIESHNRLKILLRTSIQSVFNLDENSPLMQLPDHEILTILVDEAVFRIDEILNDREDFSFFEATKMAPPSLLPKKKKHNSRLLKKSAGKKNISESSDSESDLDASCENQDEGLALERAKREFQEPLPVNGIESLTVGSDEPTLLGFSSVKKSKRSFRMTKEKNLVILDVFKNDQLYRSYEIFIPTSSQQKVPSSIDDHLAQLYDEFLGIAQRAEGRGVSCCRVYTGEESWKAHDPYHRFSKHVDAYLKDARYVPKDKDGATIHFARLRGSMFFPQDKRKVYGSFEYAFNREGLCFHRFFRPDSSAVSTQNLQPAFADGDLLPGSEPSS